MDYKEKYFKYKQKYLILKGGVVGQNERDNMAALPLNPEGRPNWAAEIVGVGPGPGEPAEPIIVGVGPGRPAEPIIVGVGPAGPVEPAGPDVDDLYIGALIYSDPEKAIELVNIYIGKLTENIRLLDQKIIELKELIERISRQRTEVNQQLTQMARELRDLKNEFEQSLINLSIKKDALRKNQDFQKASEQQILLAKRNSVEEFKLRLQGLKKISHQEQSKAIKVIDELEKKDVYGILKDKQTKEIILKREIEEIEQRVIGLKMRHEERRVEFVELKKKLDDLDKEYTKADSNHFRLTNRERRILSTQLQNAQKELENAQKELEKKKFPERVKLREEQAKLREEEYDRDLKRRKIVTKKNWPIWYKELMERPRGIGFDRYLDATKEYPNKSDVEEDRTKLLDNYERILWINDLVPQWWLDGLKEKLHIE